MLKHNQYSDSLHSNTYIPKTNIHSSAPKVFIDTHIYAHVYTHKIYSHVYTLNPHIDILPHLYTHNPYLETHIPMHMPVF